MGVTTELAFMVGFKEDITPSTKKLMIPMSSHRTNLSALLDIQIDSAARLRDLDPPADIGVTLKTMTGSQLTVSTVEPRPEEKV